MTDTFEAPLADTSGAPPGHGDEAPAGDTSEAPPGDTIEPLWPALVGKTRSVTVKTDPDGIVPEEPRHPWERLPTESPTQYRAFEIYRGMDPTDRSLKRMGTIVETRQRATGPVKVTPYGWRAVTRWSLRNEWQKRVRAWDDEAQRQSANKQMRDTVAMHERHINLSLRMQQVVAERLKEMNPDELTRRDIDRWLEKATRMERQARGVERIGQAGNVQNLQLGVHIQNQPGGRNGLLPRDDIPMADDTPIGDYLMAHPGDVSVAVNVINELLGAVSGEGSDKSG